MSKALLALQALLLLLTSGCSGDAVSIKVGDSLRYDRTDSSAARAAAANTQPDNAIKSGLKLSVASFELSGQLEIAHAATAAFVFSMRQLDQRLAAIQRHCHSIARGETCTIPAGNFTFQDNTRTNSGPATQVLDNCSADRAVNKRARQCGEIRYTIGDAARWSLSAVVEYNGDRELASYHWNPATGRMLVRHRVDWSTASNRGTHHSHMIYNANSAAEKRYSQYASSEQ